MPGEHKVHPYLHLETLCRGSVNILHSPLYWIPLFFAMKSILDGRCGALDRMDLVYFWIASLMEESSNG